MIPTWVRIASTRARPAWGPRSGREAPLLLFVLAVGVLAAVQPWRAAWLAAPVLTPLGTLATVFLGIVIEALPFRLEHGPNYDALGFRFGSLGYAPDVSAIPPEAMAAMSGLDTLILDCLREAPHPSHFNLEQSLEAIAQLRPRRTILTNLHVDLDYAKLAKRLPDDIEPAFDGMQLTVEA